MPFPRPGVLAYRFFFRPLAPVFRARERGFAATLRAALGERAMRSAARRLAPSPVPAAPAAWPALCLMTGARHWHQTVFCLRSLEAACGLRFRVELLDDGTLSAPLRAALGDLLPGASVLDSAAAFSRASAALPPARFPHLHRLRAGHILMRKLIDLRAGCRGPRLFLDSDMLFFARPDRLLSWLAEPTGAFCLDDSPPPGLGNGDGSLGYVLPRAEIEARLGHPLLPFANTGIVALDDAVIDWPALEDAAARLLPGVREVGMMEQTLAAVQLSRLGATLLPPSDYRCLYLDAPAPPAVLLHYLHRAKDRYAVAEWRRWLASR